MLVLQLRMTGLFYVLMFAVHSGAREVCSLLKLSVTAKEKWEIIGNKLGLNTEILKSIGLKHRLSEQRLFAVITAWVQRKGPAHSKVTLRTLVKVLRNEKVGEGVLAAEVMKRKGETYTYYYTDM